MNSEQEQAKVGVRREMMISLQFEEIIAALWPGDILGPIFLIAITWIGSALLLRYHCRKQDLVGQGK